VRGFDAGNTPNGVRQLIGNVWEWVDAQFYPNSAEGVSVILDEAMAEIRGAAFNTYFHSQATCQFRTGQPLLFRGSNVGFRCCISGNVLLPPLQSSTTDESVE
jgi:iron(II)-dependent oxidoreductase